MAQTAQQVIGLRARVVEISDCVGDLRPRRRAEGGAGHAIRADEKTVSLGRTYGTGCLMVV